MAVYWPSSLENLINADSFQVKMGDTVLRSEMDVGLAKTRRRFTSPIDTYSCSINIYQSDYGTFYDFYNVTLNGGITPFEFVDPLTGNLSTFRFLNSPSISPLGSAGWFILSMNWEKMP